MSQDNVEVVRRAFPAFQAGDFGGFLARLDDALVTRRLAPLPDPGTWRGPDGMLEVLADWVDTFDEFTITEAEFIDAGDHVVARVAQQGRVRGGGLPVPGTFWFVFGLRDEKVVTFDMYGTSRQAFEAAGLRE
jgi:ketosteroid isomerase-like protein